MAIVAIGKLCFVVTIGGSGAVDRGLGFNGMHILSLTRIFSPFLRPGLGGMALYARFFDLGASHHSEPFFSRP